VKDRIVLDHYDPSVASLPQDDGLNKNVGVFMLCGHKRIVLLLFVLLLLAMASAREAAGGQRPFFDARDKQTQYEGPGRDEPAPKDLKEVRIGYFGPADPAHASGGDIWLAVNLAVEEANAEGGYRGLPFILVPGWAENPWGNGINQVARMVFIDKVWAIIGGIDGPSTHLAEQVVAKAHLTLISPASTDKTVHMANIPWMFSALPGDHLFVPILGKALLEEAGEGKFGIISSTDHDSHQFLIELEKYLAKQRAAPSFRLEFQSGRQDHSEMVRQATAAAPKTLVLIAGVQDSAHVVNTLRREGFKGKIFGGPAMGRRLFQDLLATDSAALYFPKIAGAEAITDRFARDFKARFGFFPDYAVRHAYESTRLLLTAICRAGLNRPLIADAVRQLSPWRGKAASIEWDPLGQSQGSVILGTLPSKDYASSAQPVK
jgi:branched-chain amino acid transport system substrate-binding protein